VQLLLLMMMMMTTTTITTTTVTTTVATTKSLCKVGGSLFDLNRVRQAFWQTTPFRLVHTKGTNI
jgi:hypothetical protein